MLLAYLVSSVKDFICRYTLSVLCARAETPEQIVVLVVPIGMALRSRFRHERKRVFCLNSSEQRRRVMKCSQRDFVWCTGAMKGLFG